MIKQFLAAIALILTLASPVWAVVAYDSASGDDSAGSPSDFTGNWTHTTASGNNRVLLIGCYSRVDKGAPTVTVDAVAATLWASNTAGSDGLATLHYRIGQAVGSNTMVATYADDPTTDQFACSSLSFTGVHQTTPLGTAVTANTTGATSLSVDLLIASGELGVDVLGRRTAETLTVGSGQTQRANRCTTTGSTEVCSGMSTSATVGTEAMNWTWTSSLVAHTIAAAVKAASSVIPTKPVFLD